MSVSCPRCGATLEDEGYRYGPPQCIHCGRGLSANALYGDERSRETNREPTRTTGQPQLTNEEAEAKVRAFRRRHFIMHVIGVIAIVAATAFAYWLSSWLRSVLT